MGLEELTRGLAQAFSHGTLCIVNRHIDRHYVPCTDVETVDGDSESDVSVGTMLNQSALLSAYAIILVPPAPRCPAAVTDVDDDDACGGAGSVLR